MLKTFKFRIYPNSAQEQKLLRHLDLCRNLYNAALQERKDYYRKTGKTRSYVNQCSTLPDVKEVAPEYSEVHSQILQDVLKRVDKAYKNFFRRVKNGTKPGFPRFQGRDRYNSFTFPQSGFSVNPKTNRIKFSNIGHIKTVLHREITGKIKTCTVIKGGADKWYVCFSVDIGVPEPLPKTNNIIGLDLGLSNFITTSENQVVKPAKTLKKNLKRLQKVSRQFSQIKTPQRKKAVARVHEKIRNSRDNFQHQIANDLIRNHDVICIEDLDVAGMLNKFGTAFNRAIMDVGWSIFTLKLSYKAEYAGRMIIKVDPQLTSKTCSCCGHVNHDLKLEDRVFKCPNCKMEMDRDLNAARNIKFRGMKSKDFIPEKPNWPGNTCQDPVKTDQDASIFR